MAKIITTVGVSIFTNYQDENVKHRYGYYYESIDDPYNHLREASALDIYDNRLSPYIHNISDKIKDFWFANEEVPNSLASAEITSILKIAEEEPTEYFIVHLLATDTLLSVLAAELIRDWFDLNKGNYPNIKKVLFQRQSTEFIKQSDSDYVVKDLRISIQGSYESGFMHLIEVLNRISRPKNTILNITGGYKAIAPILTLYGQLKELPLKYLYNEQDLKNAGTIITVKNLPVHFDLGYIEERVPQIMQPDKIKDINIVKKLYELGLVRAVKIPAELTIMGLMIQQKILTEIPPFQKTMMGYFVEYKLYEYFNKNIHKQYKEVQLGYKLSNEPGKEMEDADLLLKIPDKEDSIIVEIKPLTIDKEDLRKKLEKLIALSEKLPIKINELWIIFYEYENSGFNKGESWCRSILADGLEEDYPDIKFAFKKILIARNIIDGEDNRVLYHEFMRSRLSHLTEIYNTENQKDIS